MIVIARTYSYYVLLIFRDVAQYGCFREPTSVVLLITQVDDRTMKAGFVGRDAASQDRFPRCREQLDYQSSMARVRESNTYFSKNKHLKGTYYYSSGRYFRRSAFFPGHHPPSLWISKRPPPSILAIPLPRSLFPTLGLAWVGSRR